MKCFQQLRELGRRSVALNGTTFSGNRLITAFVEYPAMLCPDYSPAGIVR